MKKLIFGLSLLLSLGACKTAQTQDNATNQEQRKGPPPVSELLSKMDANKDGKLSKAEVKGPLSDDFTKIDANKDGFLSEAELEKMPPPPKRGERPPR